MAPRRARTAAAVLGVGALGVGVATILGGCTSSGSTAQPASPSTPSPSVSSHPTSTTSTSTTSTSHTVWLCRPGATADPCSVPFEETSVAADGTRSTHPARPTKTPDVDCFYVYPTVSTEKTTNSDLKIQYAEKAAAFAQASPFSKVCRVWAPMYRQATVAALTAGKSGKPHPRNVAYQSLLSGWQDYLAHDNHGRPVVFIGHSQGSAMLIRLLDEQVDQNPALRSRTLLTILAGGNVTVPTGKNVGATFKNLGLCTSAQTSHCVIAYSTFPKQPPAFSLFGRAGSGVSALSGQTASAGLQVACVNPVDYANRVATLTPEFPSAAVTVPGGSISTPWVTFPRMYRTSCHAADGASWLQVNAYDRGARPVVTESLGPAWGFHRDDISLALGNLVQDVAVAEANAA